MAAATTADDDLMLLAFARFLRNHTAAADTTIAIYESDVRSFAAFLRERQMRLRGAVPADCDRYVAHLWSTDARQDTIRRRSTALRHFYKFLGVYRPTVILSEGGQSHGKEIHPAPGPFDSPADDTVDRALSEFIASVREKVSPHTLRAYKADLKKFVGFVGTIAAEKVESTCVESFLSNLQEKGLSPASRARHAAALRAFCAWMAGCGLLGHNPVAAHHMRRSSEVRDPDVPQKSELQAVLRVRSSGLYERDRFIWLLLYACGLRSSEVVSIDLKDIDIKRGILSVSGRKSGRYVSLSKEVIEALRAYLPLRNELLCAAKGPSDALILNWRGARLTVRSLTRSVHKMGASLNLHVQPRTLRHAHAVHALRDGAELHGLRHALGLTGATTVERLSRLR